MLDEMNLNLIMQEHGESREIEQVLKKPKKSHDQSELIDRSILESKFENMKCDSISFPNKLVVSNQSLRSQPTSSVFGTHEKTMSWCTNYSINNEDQGCGNENIDFLFSKSISIPEECTHKELDCSDNWFIKDVNSEFLYTIYSERLLNTVLN